MDKVKKKKGSSRLRLADKERKRKRKRKRKTIKTIITTIVVSILVPSLGVLANVVGILDPIKDVYKQIKIHNTEKEIEIIKETMPTIEPVHAGAYVAVTSVCPNEYIPDVFSFEYNYDFTSLEILDKDLSKVLSEAINDILKRNWPEGEYDDYDTLKAKRIEEKLKRERDNLPSDEVERLYEDLINERIRIHTNAKTSASVILLAQAQQDYADFLVKIYNSTHNTEKNNLCVEYSLKAVENFILGMSYKRVDKTIGDVLYRMALSYNTIASIKDYNANGKRIAFSMANALYKLSIEKGDDINHGNEAYYNLGRNYVSLYMLMQQVPTLVSADDAIYYVEEAYKYLKFYMKPNISKEQKKKVYTILNNVSDWLIKYYEAEGNLNKAYEYNQEWKEYTEFLTE